MERERGKRAPHGSYADRSNGTGTDRSLIEKKELGFVQML